MPINHDDDGDSNTAESSDSEEGFVETEADLATWADTFNDEEMIDEEDHEDDAGGEEDDDTMMGEAQEIVELSD